MILIEEPCSSVIRVVRGSTAAAVTVNFEGMSALLLVKLSLSGQQVKLTQKFDADRGSYELYNVKSFLNRLFSVKILFD